MTLALRKTHRPPQPAKAAAGDAVLADLLAIGEAHTLPREEVVHRAIQEVADLRRSGHLNDEQATVLLREIVAASITSRMGGSILRALEWTLLGHGEERDRRGRRRPFYALPRSRRRTLNK